MKILALTVSMAFAFAVTGVQATDLETPEDRLSYTIGMDIGQSLADQEADLDIDILIEGLRAVFMGEETRMTLDEARAVRDDFIRERQQAMETEREGEAERNLEEGRQFLAENRERDDVTETESGLQYRVIEEGDGPRPAGPESQVTVHYTGTLIDGETFDSSHDRGEPTSFALNQVIPGWTEGLQLMREGSTYEFFIPGDLAYGDQGRPGPIGPNSTLIFEVELISVQD